MSKAFNELDAMFDRVEKAEFKDKEITVNKPVEWRQFMRLFSLCKKITVIA